MKVGIYFSDNDFHYTLEAFMESLINVYRNHDSVQDKRRGAVPFSERMFTKEHIVILFNTLALGLYYLHQNQFRYNGLETSSDYLRIDTKHVFLGNEVDQYIKDHDGWANGEFQYIDLGYNTVHCI